MNAKEILLKNIMPSSYPPGINETEKKAFRWLMMQGLEENNIQFSPARSPDFLTPLGGYEVKKLYKAKTLEDYVYFNRGQYERLLELNTNIVIFSDDSDEPCLVTTMKELEGKIRVYIPPKHEFNPGGKSFIKEEVFLTKMVLDGKITIPYEVREMLNLKTGDFVRIQIEKRYVEEEAEG